MAWSCRSHSPPWSQIGQSSGWLISRNSITPSRALRTIGERVLTSGGSPLGPGRQSRTPHAQLATGFGEPTSSTRHMRQLPAIDSRSWKQKRGISPPAASHACRSVYSGGTSISLPSTRSLVMWRTASKLGFQTFDALLEVVDVLLHALIPHMGVTCEPESSHHALVYIVQTLLDVLESLRMVRERFRMLGERGLNVA